MMKLSPVRSVLLVLLTQLSTHGTHAHGTHAHAICQNLQFMVHKVNVLWRDAKHLHQLTGTQVQDFDAVEQTIRNLPQITHTVDQLVNMKVDQSLSLMFSYTQSFSEHMLWLRSAQEKVSVASHSSGRVTHHLLQLSDALNNTLQQIGEKPPPSPTSPPSPSSPPSPPSPTSPPSAFKVLLYSVKTSDGLTKFCDLSKRLLHFIKQQLRCA